MLNGPTDPGASSREARRRALVGAAVAVAGPALVAAGGWAASLAGEPGPGLLFLLTVVGATLAGGLRAGLLATALSFVLLEAFFVDPTGPLDIDVAGLTALVAFAAAAVVVARLLARERAARIDAERVARELGLVLEAGQMGTWRWDVASRRVHWSSTLERVHGFEPGTFPGTFAAFASEIHPDDRVGTIQAIERALAGDGAYEHEYRIVRSDGQVRWLRAGGQVRRDEDGTPLSMSGVCTDVTARRRAREDETFLVLATELLSQSLKARKTLARVARLAVPTLADWCSVEILERSGRIRNVALAHVDPEKVRLVTRLRAAYPPDPDAPDGVPQVLRTGESELYPEIGDQLLERFARDDEHLRLLRELGLQSAIVAPMIARGRTVGAITLAAAESGRRYDDKDVALAQELARRAALALDNSRLYAAQRAARREAQSSATRTSLLQSVTAELSDAGTRADVAAVVARRAAETLSARGAAIFSFDKDAGAFELVASSGLPEAQEWAGFPAGIGEPVRNAVASGKLVVVEPPGELVAPLPRERAHRPEPRDGAAICAPLLLEGRALGVLYLPYRRARRITAQERELVASLARTCAQALERARLRELEREMRARALRLARRLRHVQDVVDATLASRSLDELLDDLLARVREALGADTASILIVDEEDGALVVRASLGVGEASDPPDRIAVGAGFAGRIAATGRSATVDDPSPDDLESVELAAGGVASLAGVPLVPDGRVTGVLQVGSFDRGRFTEDDLSFLRLVADRAALAIERTRLFEREHRTAQTLQRSLLPRRLPELAGLDVAARYLPGSAGIEVGGDWYDVIPLADGTVGVVVGDVVGRGIPAASAMGQLRNALRTYAFEGFSPSAAIERLNRLTEELGEGVFATLVYAVLDPDADTMRFTVAGHPPPLLIRPDGSRGFLEGGRCLPLGARADVDYEEAVVSFEPGATLVLYTDGLVERRDAPLDEGLGRLERAIVSGPEDVEELLDHVLERLTDRSHADDVALVAVRRAARPAERLRLRLPALPSSLPAARAALREWLDGAAVGPERAEDVVLAVNEACANAVEHPLEPRAPVVEIEASVADGVVRIVVRDHGRWRPPVRDGSRGQGLLLMRALAESIEVRPTPEGTFVEIRAPVAARALVSS